MSLDEITDQGKKLWYPNGKCQCFQTYFKHKWNNKKIFARVIDLAQDVTIAVAMFVPEITKWAYFYKFQ